MATAPILTTPHLFLRSLENEDCTLVCEYLTDPEIAQNTLLLPYPCPPATAEGWIRSARAALRDGRSYTFAIVLRETQHFIGSVSLSLEPEHDRGELGFWIGKPYRNRGAASEAAARMLGFGFDVLRLNRIYAFCFAHNRASSRVLEKIGMAPEGVQRGHYRKSELYLDANLYGVLREDFNARRGQEGVA